MTRQENLELFCGGKTVILPIDHGVAIPVPGLEDPLVMVEKTIPFVDGYVVNLGVVMRSANMLEGKGVCLRTDIYNTRTEGPGAGTINVFGIEEAEMVVRRGDEHALSRRCQRAGELSGMRGSDSDEHGFRDPRDFRGAAGWVGQAAHYTVENIQFAARLSAELGADVVKVPYPPGATRRMNSVKSSKAALSPLSFSAALRWGTTLACSRW